jgi:hypothetical protein
MLPQLKKQNFVCTGKFTIDLSFVVFLTIKTHKLCSGLGSLTKLLKWNEDEILSQGLDYDYEHKAVIRLRYDSLIPL